MLGLLFKILVFFFGTFSLAEGSNYILNGVVAEKGKYSFMVIIIGTYYNINA